MDFDQAIAAHTAWKKELRERLVRRDGSLHSSEIAREDKCELGKWIRSKSARYASLPEFAELRTNHAQFHKVAADLVLRAARDASVSAEMLIGAKSEFSAATAAVIRSLIEMKKRVSKSRGRGVTSNTLR